MSFLSTFVRSFYAKALFVIVVGVTGMVVGIRIGYSYLLGKADTTTTNTHNEEYPPITLMFGLGDLLPWEPYTAAQGDTGNFEQLLNGKESILFFVHVDCESCIDLLKLWRKEVIPKLRPGTQMVACLPKSSGEMPGYYEALFDGMKVVTYDDDVWKRKYNMKLYPTMLGVDRSGFVVAQQFGFEGIIDFAFVNRFCYGR